MDFAAPDPWNRIGRDLENPSRRRVMAAVAYVGVDAPSVMALRIGDVLVCDASTAAIRAGTTSASALKTFQRRGVEIFSVEALHAKVIAGSRWVWIGSANASANSRDDLIEASVRVTETQTVRRVKSWINAQCTEDRRLSRFDITHLSSLPVRRQAFRPVRSRPLHGLPDPSELKWLVPTSYGMSTKAKRAAERERSDVRRVQHQQQFPKNLDFMESTGIDCPFRRGDWFVEVYHGHPRRPAVVVRVSQIDSRRWLVWTAEVDSSNRPRLAELIEACGLSREEWDETVYPSRLRPRHRQGVLDLYR